MSDFCDDIKLGQNWNIFQSTEPSPLAGEAQFEPLRERSRAGGLYRTPTQFQRFSAAGSKERGGRERTDSPLWAFGENTVVVSARIHTARVRSLVQKLRNCPHNNFASLLKTERAAVAAWVVNFKTDGVQRTFADFFTAR
ncbi:hypothetical protein HPB50_009727 [Hyalomma asiaticum]|uniref:Uncharacterized protein n=1 Tax=Hyalomma asiaticum TaxID=266040 RepID=A0ACB7THE2_HYAAI|nr:hypothetical protein HPB50_009727 [Hyalomma asiaticum]